MSAGFFWRSVAALLLFFAPASVGVAAMPVQPLSASVPEASAVGRLICRSGGRVEGARAWVVAAADVVVTAAHPLFAAGRAAGPHQCVFRLYHADGSVREAARIASIASPWQDARRRGDNSWDYAVLRLERPLVVRPLQLVARGRAGGEGRVQLASYPSDSEHRLHLTGGEAHNFPVEAFEDAAAGLRISEPSRLFVSSAASAGGSSGGVYYVAGSRKVAGLHVGRICKGATGGDCFGFGLRIGADLVAAIDDVAGRPSARADSFAMVTPSR